MSYYDSSNSFINKLNNLKLRNYNYFETNKKTIDRPREKYNSFVENGNRILSKFDGLQNKNTNQNPYMKDKPFFQSQKFSGTDNLLSQGNDYYSFNKNSKREKTGEDFSNYYFNKNKYNIRNIDDKENKYNIRNIDDKDKNDINNNEYNEISEMLNSIISSKIGLRNLGETCYMNVCLKNSDNKRIFKIM